METNFLFVGVWFLKVHPLPSGSTPCPAPGGLLYPSQEFRIKAGTQVPWPHLILFLSLRGVGWLIRTPTYLSALQTLTGCRPGPVLGAGEAERGCRRPGRREWSPGGAGAGRSLSQEAGGPRSIAG